MKKVNNKDVYFNPLLNVTKLTYYLKTHLQHYLYDFFSLSTHIFCDKKVLISGRV